MSRHPFLAVMVDIRIGQNLKLARLPVAERWCFLAVLCIAAMASPRGCLRVGEREADASDLALQANVKLAVARSAVAHFGEAGMLERDEELGCWRVTNWDDWQREPRSDATNTERQRRHRERHREDRNVTHNVSNAGEVEVEVEGEVEDSLRSSSSAPVPAADPEIARLCHLFADLILERDPRARVAPESKRWHTDMRRLLADRKGDHAEVERVLRWSQADPFWQSNILSPTKLRAQFTQLRQRAASPSAKDEATATRQRRAAAMQRQIGASS